MKILLNEKPLECEAGSTIASIRKTWHPHADVLVRNGAVASDSDEVHEGDSVFMVQRGAVPDADELEFLMAARHTPGVHAKLKKARVGIAGAGGLGSHVAVALARSGVGTIVIADFDVVEPTNLNRQHYFIEQLGMNKVDALAETIARINPYLTVIPLCIALDSDNIPSAFSDCSIVIEAFDRADMKSMLVDSVINRLDGTAVIAASGLAGYSSSNSITTRMVSRRFYLVGDGVSEALPGEGLMAPRVSIAAGHQANLAISLIIGDKP